MIFHFKRGILGASIILLPLLSNLSAQAQIKTETTDLKVYREDQQQQSCPNKVRIIETPQPYREGGFATDGFANLNAIASNLAISASDNFSTTWVGTLKPNYIKCLGSAGSDEFKIHFVKGKIYFTLDLAGKYDPNEYPLVVLKKGIKNGNPTWTWGGTD